MNGKKVVGIIVIFMVGLIFFSPAATTKTLSYVEISQPIAYNFRTIIELGVLVHYPPDLLVPGSFFSLEELFWLLEKSKEELHAHPMSPGVEWAAATCISTLEEELQSMLQSTFETSSNSFKNQISTIEKELVKQKESFNISGDTRVVLNSSGTGNAFQEGNIRFKLFRNHTSLVTGIGCKGEYGGSRGHWPVSNYNVLLNLNAKQKRTHQINCGFQYLSLNEFLFMRPQVRISIFDTINREETRPLFTGISYSGQYDSLNWNIFRGKQDYVSKSGARYKLPINQGFVQVNLQIPLQISYEQYRVFNTTSSLLAGTTKNDVRTLNLLWNRSPLCFEMVLAKSQWYEAEDSDAQKGNVIKLAANYRPRLKNTDVTMGIKLFKIDNEFKSVNGCVAKANKFGQLVPGAYYNNLGGYTANIELQPLGKTGFSLAFNHEEQKALTPPYGDGAICYWRYNIFSLVSSLPKVRLFGQINLKLSSEWGEVSQFNMEEQHYYIFEETVTLPLGQGSRLNVLGKQELSPQNRSKQVGIKSRFAITKNTWLDIMLSKILSSPESEAERKINTEIILRINF